MISNSYLEALTQDTYYSPTEREIAGELLDRRTTYAGYLEKIAGRLGLERMTIIDIPGTYIESDAELTKRILEELP